jgi:hypothetical protein
MHRQLRALLEQAPGDLARGFNDGGGVPETIFSLHDGV